MNEVIWDLIMFVIGFLLGFLIGYFYVAIETLRYIMTKIEEREGADEKR